MPNSNFKKMKFIILIIVFFICEKPLFAETKIFSYINEKGKIVYTNTPSLSYNEYSLNEDKIKSYENFINNISNLYQIDSKLIHAIILVESNYNPYAVSKKGAKGIMQLMPSTAKRYGVKQIFDPIENIIGGVKYLKDLLKIFDGDLKYALAAYNAGENMIRYYGGIPPFEETRQYVQKVLSIYDKVGGKRFAYKYRDLNDKIHYSFEKPLEGTYKSLTLINLNE